MKDTNIKILVVDDSAFMRKVLIDILQKEGFTNIIEAENGKQAIKEFYIEKPELVLLDIIMPEVDGMETLKTIGRDTKVIMISAVGQESVIKEAMSMGAQGFIVKPFENSKVIEEMSKVLE